MNEKFYELPGEKQLRIINAALEVFAQNDYKRASTEQIALRAGISKGLLFYYFHNKKTLYLFLYEYAQDLIKQNVLDARFAEITDFFELCAYAAQCKYRLLSKSPHIMDFILRGYYTQKEEVSAELNQKIQTGVEGIYLAYFTNIDYSRFREGVDPQNILQMLTWMADGYLHERQRTGEPPDLDEMMEKFHAWTVILKKATYKEAY